MRRSKKGGGLPPLHQLRPEVREVLAADPTALDTLLRESGLADTQGRRGKLGGAKQGGAGAGADGGDDDPRRRLDPLLVGVGVRVPGVTAAELRELQKFMKRKWEDRFTTLRRGFLLLDEQRSGCIEKDEFQMCFVMMNLGEVVRPEVFDALFQLVDADHSGRLDWNEFSRFLCDETLVPR